MNQRPTSLPHHPYVDGLGLGGLIPFVFFAVAIATDVTWVEMANVALTTYTVAVISFIGAVAWGLALADPNLTHAHRQRLFVWGVAPSLLAWLAALADAPVRYGLLIATLWLAWWAETRLFPTNILTQRWRKLRLRLSTAVTLCLAIAWYGQTWP
jgi:hypothetical protein